ncbi:GSCFA domain-containing protein [Hymenobacter glacialis]|uniref:GSCFA domain-containing protein n=1 Tax=Hymenobacter glacialis TaxID=1908236 RepID=A0A1G1SUP2_9BACT|nr:GSCFA domain-containing protein [Hymenobacter glacialis]OGX82339.1 hypothetical protein BEN48_05180 [Hymenobacter glacialis]
MFRTELSIAPATDQLARTARVLTLGSCFADSIGARLTAVKVTALVNPFGTVFQPLALAKLLRAAAGEEVDWQQHVLQARGRWQSYDLHGSIGADSPVELLQYIQELVRRTGEFLRQADVVLLTLGTAWAYRLRETGELVNNCHKQSADLFVKELLTPDEIINGLAETHAYLRRINPNVRFVLTVSPVRHLKDTLPLNSVSKSVLRVATHIVSDLLPGVAYFPAYEVLMDDLRDYRFYASDMLHPTEVAEDYIWDKFARTYFDADFGRFRKEWASVQQSLGHRPLHEGAPEHREFLENTLQKLEQLSLRKVEVAAELNMVRAKISSLPVPKQPEPVDMMEDDEERIDIGEGSVAREAQATPREAVPASPNAGNRPPRLSPEEFRAQRGDRSGRPERGRRDGRGKGQSQVPTENEQFQTANTATNAFGEVDALLNPILLAPGALGVAEQSLEMTALPAAANLGGSLGDEEPGKKKKRRSRGGAKRTARKNALRLASGELTADETDSENTTGADTAVSGSNETVEATQMRQEGRKASVITKSQPVKRGGRGNESGRVPRVALYTPTTDASIEENAGAPADAAASAPEDVDTGTGQLPTAAATAEAGNNGPVTSPNSRNRGRRNTASAVTPEAGGGQDLAAPSQPEPSPATGNAEQLSNQPAPDVRAGRNPNANASQAAKPVAEAVATASDSDVTDAPVAAPARRTSRPKRAVSQARAEKPAVDTHVIPVPDSPQLRTQVAAGRMTGSSATLIERVPEAAAPIKKAAATTKEAAPRAKAPKAAVLPVPIPASEESKPKPVKKAAPVAKAKAAPKTKAEAKPKATPVAKAKAEAKPKAAPVAKTKVASKPEVAPLAKAKAAAKPKAAAAKPAAKPAPKKAAAKPVAAKPKAPRKPAKPA